jgi:hypothetical protein
MSNTFIFTEAYNCGIIAREAIRTFLMFHPDHSLNVFGKDVDIEEIGINDARINYISLDLEEELSIFYENGHQGTAHLFASVLLKKFGDYDKIIHFDSDVIFRDECISDIFSAFASGFSLIGQRRNYEKNRQGLDSLYGISLKGVPDTVGTCFFGMKLDKLTVTDIDTVRKMCVGGISLTGEPIIDFFDPVSFHVMHNDGKLKYLDFIDYGGNNENGSWDNGFPELNLMCDFGRKFVHFAGVGSGLNFTKNGSVRVPDSYSNWAKKRYNLYSMLFYGETNGDYDMDSYQKILKELNI